MDHPLFRRFPITGTRSLSNGENVGIPYHIYDGDILMIGGTIRAESARELLKNETLDPVLTVSGRAPMIIWVCNFSESPVKPHGELQFSLLSSDDPQKLSDHPLALLARFIADPTLRMICHGLWNTTPLVVAYNRELLGLNARIASGGLKAAGSQWEFSFADENNAPLITGRSAVQKSQAPGAMFNLMGKLGFANSMKMARAPWLEMRVVNPIGILPENRTAIAAAAGSTRFFRAFAPALDSLTIHAAGYTDFQPGFVFQLRGCNFVYCQPT